MVQPYFKLMVAAGVSALALTAPTVSAQTTAPAAGDEKLPVLEEIIVTADRKYSFSADLVQAGSFRGARQLDTPLTINVIPQEVLQSQQAQGLMDAMRNTAGVTSSQTSPVVYSNLAIRGINVENRGNYRLNGSLPIINLTDLPLEDKDRVEALKGASALYYGFTTPSGVINLTMKRPTDQTLVTTNVNGNSHGAAGGHVDLSGTYGMFGARVNAVYARVDSGIDYTRGDRSLISGAFDFKPTDDLTISLDVEHINKDVVEPAIFRFTQPTSTAANPYPSIALPPLLKPGTNFGPDWGNNDSRETNVLGHVNWRINDAWAATFDYGTSKLRRERRFSYLIPTNIATGAGTLNVGLQASRFKNENMRGELAGAFFTGPLEHELLIGASRNIRDQFSPSTINIDCRGGISTRATPATCAQNFFTPHSIIETPMPASFTATTSRIDDIGYYAFDRIKYDEWLSLLVGVRRSDYTESVRGGATTFEAEPTSVSYGAVVKPVSWVSLYGTYIEGLESTPAAPSTVANVGVQLPATTSTQYEGGVKVEPYRGLLLQAAYFDISRAATFVNGANLYVQDGEYRYRGVEASVTGEITSELSVYASAMFLKARVESGAPSSTAANGAFTPTIVGKRVENTPKTTLSLSAQYKLDEWVEGLSVNGGAYYTGKRAINPLNQAFIPSYTLYNLGGAYQFDLQEQPVTLRINAENITNKRYWASTGALLLAQGAPRTVKFQVGTTF
ncbi:TonB-dependent siderophore receptor [Niveispirillum sp.]|uniref:TonB-dependent siderophore receptor n=1 Tax=Niveispirillum sp. TaxID=1917217 RepID=UPI001B48336E|nr:TonB-dependent siderophore receptor [Niveispirillum sp.]MBP7338676.1 TonB-dependent siderophore receptor [Niveispirillum sp.]